MPMQRITIQDQAVQRVQDNAAKAISDLEVSAQINHDSGAQQSITTPFTGGHLITNIGIFPGKDNLISHRLNKQLTIWVICQINSNATVWSPASATLGNSNADAQFLNLWTNTPVTVSIWVA